MTRRERVLKALNFEETDRVPMDLDGMASTGISCFAYPRLVETLGLPYRPPKVYDTGQMLAMPENDVLDALDCDITTIHGDITNAFDQPGMWKPYDFNGRLPALVRHPDAFRTLPDGTIVQHGSSRMPPTSHVFENEHGGQPISLDGEIPRPDLAEVRRQCEGNPITDEQVRACADLCRRVRETSDRAIFLNGPGANISIGAWGGIGVFPLLCMVDPDFVLELHEIVVSSAIRRIEALMAEVHPYIDVYSISSDDWGTQSQTICAPEVYRDLFMPFYGRVNDRIHAIAPGVKTFLHSCGGIYDILDYVIDSGFDILNPVQWTAGGHLYTEWKDKARGKLTLWGGGVRSQTTLPLGTVEDVEREVAEIVAYMKKDGGFVFACIHNILAEIAPEKVVAMYRSAARV